MIATIITIFMVIAIVGFSGKGDTWAIVGCVAVIVIVWIAHMCSVEDARARVNRTNYWAMSGKDRAKARHEWEREARAEEKAEARLAAERKEQKERNRRDREKARLEKETSEEKARKEEEYRRLKQVEERAKEGATREREARTEDLRSGKETVRTVSAGRSRVCRHCGRRIREDGTSAISGLDTVTAYKCPVCGYGSVTRMRT